MFSMSRKPIAVLPFCLRRSLNLALLTALLGAQPAAYARRSSPPAGEIAASAQFEALPLDRSRQNHLIVRAFINGKAALLGVDTGAPFSAIAINRRQHFGIVPITGPSRVLVNGAISAVGIAKSLRIGGLTLSDQPMVALNFGGASRAGRMRAEQEIDGLLWADILFPLRAILDCQRQLLILNLNPDSEKPTPGVDYTGFTSIPIHVSAGYNLYVDGAVNGTPAQLLVDTGAFATLLHRPFVKQMKIPLHDTRFRSAGVNMGGTNVQVARIRRLTVGSINFDGHRVGVIDLGALISTDSLEAKRPVAGLLGGELLQLHHGIIDFGTRRLYLKG
jgi:predicted aspartyl protease